ncbi:transmembrane protein, putative (macronuclear) [Tetrahymena thermophila SB210]|uniref:Transmembrane protein, putative n=1 Tax=Tetrahymena thermophila (strain SB210) TaxID=312017 RepID=Q22GY9_TETTS|nr:transmembrane protein, putative [Tetrahymena thermophila SB210]EAR84535.2 transmembrane protein, putative [Tetrahymena thermophila SB210]|eukprot:XP_001032198.2 transmembrane protein, putative [Tetrahymena thermophila SB210]
MQIVLKVQIIFKAKQVNQVVIQLNKKEHKIQQGMLKVLITLLLISVAIADICKVEDQQYQLPDIENCSYISYFKFVSTSEYISYSSTNGQLNFYNFITLTLIQYQQTIPSAQVIEVVDEQKKLVLVVLSDNTTQVIDMINNSIFIDLGVKNDIHIIPTKRTTQINDVVYILKKQNNMYIFNQLILDNSVNVKQENPLLNFEMNTGSFSYCIKYENFIYALINDSSMSFLIVFKQINNSYQQQIKSQISLLRNPNYIQSLQIENILLISDLQNQQSLLLDLNTFQVLRMINFSYYCLSNDQFMFFWQYQYQATKTPPIYKVSIITIDKSNWQVVSNLDAFSALQQNNLIQLQMALQTQDEIPINEISLFYLKCYSDRTIFNGFFNYKPKFSGLIKPVNLKSTQQNPLTINYSNSNKLLVYSSTEIFIVDADSKSLTDYFQFPSLNITYATQIDNQTLAAGNYDGSIFIFKLLLKDGTNQRYVGSQITVKFHSSPIIQIEVDTKRLTIYSYSQLGHYITCNLKNGKQIAIQSISQLNVDTISVIKYISNFDIVFILGTMKGQTLLQFYDVSLQQLLNSLAQFKQQNYILKSFQLTTCNFVPCILIMFQVQLDAQVYQILLTNNPQISQQTTLKNLYFGSTYIQYYPINLIDSTSFLLEQKRYIYNQLNFIYYFNSKSQSLARYGPIDSTSQSISLNDKMFSVVALSDQYPNILFFLSYFGIVQSYGGCDEKYFNSLSTNLQFNYSYLDPTPIDCSSKIANCSYCFLKTSKNIPFCTLCQDGFVLFTDQSGNQQCVKDCGIGYYVDTRLMWCQQCSPICKQCSVTSQNCTACDNNLYVFNGNCVSFCQEGYYIDKNVCKQCDSSCLFCQRQSDNCTQCAVGYYLNSLNPAKGECIKCDILCQSCTDSPTNCNKCIQGVYLRQQNQCSIQPCPDGYYPDVNLGSCQQCDQNCNQCEKNSTSCTSCKKDFYLFQSKCFSKCFNGTYQSEALNECIACTQKNCMNCSQSTQKCVQIAPCKQNQFYDILSQQCQDCALPCMTCNQSENQCESCIDSFVFVKDLKTCNLRCPSRYYLDSSSNICYQCPEGCQECTSQYTCTSCIQNDSVIYIQVGVQCLSQCPMSFYKSKFQCLPCHSTCLNCSDESNLSCTECGKNLFLYKGQCLKECPNEFIKDYLSHQCVLCDPTSSGSEFSCSNMINFKIIQNNYFTNRLMLLFSQPISSKSANLPDYIVFQFRDIDPQYYKYSLIQNDPQAIELKFEIDQSILQNVLFNQIYQIRVVNSTFLKGTYTNSSIFQNYKTTGSIGVILSNSLNQNIEDYQKKIQIFIYFSLGLLTLFLLIFSQVKILVESIVHLQYLILALLYISPQSPFMYLIVKELFKFNFYGISVIIVEQSNILGQEVKKYYETGDSYIFGTQVSTNQFSSENDFLTSNFIANILRIIEWFAILSVLFILIEIVSTITSLDLLRSKENTFMKGYNTFCKISYIPVLFYSFFQLKYYDDSQFINVVSYFGSLLLVAYLGIEILKKALRNNIIENIVEEFQKFKILLAIILVVFFTNQKKEMLSILFCLDLLDIIISLNRIRGSKESQVKYCTISKVFINGVSMIIYALAISNYFYQDQNNNYINILDTQIGLIYLIFAFLYLINILVLLIFVRAYHKKEKEFIMQFYYSDNYNTKKQREIKQICQDTKVDDLRSNEIKLNFPTTQMLHSTNDINSNEYQKKRIDILEDKIQRISKYFEQKNSNMNNMHFNNELSPILNANQGVDDSPQINIKRRQESVEQVIHFSQSNDQDYNFSKDEIKKSDDTSKSHQNRFQDEQNAVIQNS